VPDEWGGVQDGAPGAVAGGHGTVNALAAALVILATGCAASRPPPALPHSARLLLPTSSVEAPVTGKETLLNPRARQGRGRARQVTTQQALAHAARVAAPACGPGAKVTPEHPVLCPR